MKGSGKCRRNFLSLAQASAKSHPSAIQSSLSAASLLVTMNYYRTAWISDLHLGSRGCKANAILNFLKNHEFETLYLVGDIVDIWALRHGIYWPQEHNDVIQKLLRKARKGTRLVYIPGNHDEFIDSFLGQFGDITIQKQALHETASGEKILVMHGHELDTVVQNLGWLAHVGDLGYKLLLELNGPVNFFRRLLGYQYWSLSAYVKNEVKNVVSFISKFEEAVAHYAADHQVRSVLCGHIHRAASHLIGSVHYYNTGDWVESCTAIVEHADGALELKKYAIDIAPATSSVPKEQRHATVNG
ncbi:MAG: UDP-2,3-diacylglucosamine diphosphatase [Verrucomicrobiales bacterium]|nr:UDP-2,3-diacylglucosamine diphosphatase [Verrucomicrobiales bacterium]